MEDNSITEKIINIINNKFKNDNHNSLKNNEKWFAKGYNKALEDILFLLKEEVDGKKSEYKNEIEEIRELAKYDLNLKLLYDTFNE